MMTRYALFLLFAVAPGCSIDARYQALTEDVDAPGAQLTVIQPDGVTSTYVAGIARGDEPVTPEQPFLIGSNTKMLTNALVLQLVDEGRLVLPSLQPDKSCSRIRKHLKGEVWLPRILPSRPRAESSGLRRRRSSCSNGI